MRKGICFLALLTSILLSILTVCAQEVVQEEIATADDLSEQLVDLDDKQQQEETKLAIDDLSEQVVDLGDKQQEETKSADSENSAKGPKTVEPPVQSGPLIDLFGPTLLSLELLDDKTAQLKEHYTNDILRGKKVIGVYFSADWCGPCVKFTPELVKFYEKMNSRRGKKDEFQIIWVSRCRDVQSYGQYFTHMPWIALPPQEAMGPRGERLSKLYGVKGIPSLTLVDDLGSVITTDARNLIPKDKAGIGFPWRHPLATLYMNIVPRSLRFMVKRELESLKDKIWGRIKTVLGRKRNAAKA